MGGRLRPELPPAPLLRGPCSGGERGAAWCRLSARRAFAGRRQRGRAAPQSWARASPLSSVSPRRFFSACRITPTWQVREQGGKPPPGSRRRAERPSGTPTPRPAPLQGRSGAAAPNTPAAPAEGWWGNASRISHPLPRRCPVAVGPGEGRAGGERATPKGLTGGTWAVTRHWADYVQQTKSVCLRASPSLHRVRLHRTSPAPPPAGPGPAWSGAESPRQPARSRLCATVEERIIPTVPGEYRRRGPTAPRQPPPPRSWNNAGDGRAAGGPARASGSGGGASGSGPGTARPGQRAAGSRQRRGAGDGPESRGDAAPWGTVRSQPPPGRKFGGGRSLSVVSFGEIIPSGMGCVGQRRNGEGAEALPHQPSFPGRGRDPAAAPVGVKSLAVRGSGRTPK